MEEIRYILPVGLYQDRNDPVYKHKLDQMIQNILNHVDRITYDQYNKTLSYFTVCKKDRKTHLLF